MLDVQRNPAGLGLQGQFSRVEIIGFGQAFLIVRNIKPRTFGDLSDEIQIFRCEIFGKGLNTCGYAIGVNRTETIRRAKAEAVERMCLRGGMLPVPEIGATLDLFDSDNNPLSQCLINFNIDLQTNTAWTNSSGIASDTDPHLARLKARSEFIEHTVLTLLPFYHDIVKRTCDVNLDELDEIERLLALFLLNRGYALRLQTLELNEDTWISFAEAYKADGWPDFIFGSAAHSTRRNSCGNAIREILLTLAARYDMILTRRTGSVNRRPESNTAAPLPCCPLTLTDLSISNARGTLYQRNVLARFDSGETLYVTRALLPHCINRDSGLVTLPVRTRDLEDLFRDFRL